ncbi:MAG TPA: hypothetical protein VFU55_05035 [Terracidiphilus sp.]|nr:hypothetical protein [Terracidiphilus sp.]
MGIFAPATGRAQDGGPPTPNPASSQTKTPLAYPFAFHFSDPITFALGSKQSAILSDFKCDMDGSIYLPIIDNISRLVSQSGPSQHVAPPMTIAALTPSGGVIRFDPQPIQGYRNVVSLLRYFVSGSSVYVLAMADKVDPSNNQNTVGRSRIIEVFNHKGELTRSIVLDPDVDPINLAAFETGEILVFSLDRFNHSTRLFLLDSAGRRESELSLFDDDFSTKLNLAAQTPTGFYSSHDGDVLSKILAVASIAPYGEDLWVAASQTNLPVLELNQHGVVRALKLSLPPGTVLQSLLPSDDDLVHALVGTFRPLSSSKSGSASEGSSRESRVFSPKEVDEFYPQDGSLFRRISLEPGQMPVCAIKGSYIFLVPRESDGRLQMIRATPTSR